MKSIILILFFITLGCNHKPEWQIIDTVTIDTLFYMEDSGYKYYRIKATSVKGNMIITRIYAGDTIK